MRGERRAEKNPFQLRTAWRDFRKKVAFEQHFKGGQDSDHEWRETVPWAEQGHRLASGHGPFQKEHGICQGWPVGGLEQKISRQVRLDHVVEASECHVKDTVLKTTASLQGCWCPSYPLSCSWLWSHGMGSEVVDSRIRSSHPSCQSASSLPFPFQLVVMMLSSEYPWNPTEHDWNSVSLNPWMNGCVHRAIPWPAYSPNTVAWAKTNHLLIVCHFMLWGLFVRPALPTLPNIGPN